MNYSLFSFLLILISSIPFAGVQQTTPGKIVVIAHRGDHGDAPENTLKAFQDAIVNGADYVEVDLRTSKDGKLVVMHDATIDRTTNASGKIKDLDFAAIQKLDVTDKKRPSLGKHKVPTFEDVLKACQGKIGIYLDFKDADVSKTWQLIGQYKMENSVVVYINAEEQYPAWRKIAPTAPLMVSLPDDVNSIASLEEFVKRVDAEILDGGVENYTPEMIRLANSKGRQVWVDVQTRDEGNAQWQPALDLGVNGMQTDHLKQLKHWLSEHGR